MSTLLIVESPGKIKKIESILGSGYKVIASYGHIIDLNKDNMSIEIENKFKPIYCKSPDKYAKIDDIIECMSDATNILLATDEDREGEMIAWSLKYVAQLQDKNLYKNKVKDCKRIVFNSITKTDLKNAIKSAKEIDMDMVHAQQARRLLDRLLGYELSPCLWGIAPKGHSASAGRVQSVVTRLIVDREKEINDFLEGGVYDYYKFNGVFSCKKQDLKAVMYDKDKNEDSDEDSETKKKKSSKTKAPAIAKIKDLESARKILEKISKSKFSISDVINKERTQNPGAPFTTSTLQQEAGRKFGFDVERTMKVAQKLYEAGYITYMRTDSTNLSKDALDNIKTYVIEKYGDEHYMYKEYKSKTKNTQEAHEACRATDVFKETATGGSDEKKLYSLIWKRTVASQMKAAIFDVVELWIEISKLDRYFFKASSETIQYLGYLLVYNLKDNDSDAEAEEEDEKLKSPSIGEKVSAKEVKALQEFKRPPPRYNQISLVNKLDPKNLNIGRPATYASIISKILNRKYVEVKDIKGMEKKITNLSWDTKEIAETKSKVMLGNDKKKLVPTDLGIKITSILMDNFPAIMDYKFTAHMEDKLDAIATGSAVWYKVLQEFYDDFHPLVLKMKQSRKDYKPDRQIIGTYPVNGIEIELMTINGKPVLKCGGKTDAVFCDVDCAVEKLTEKHAIKLLENRMKYPLKLGKHKGDDVMLHNSRNGFYIKCGTTSVTANKDTTLDQAVELITEKQKNIYNVYKDKSITYTVMMGPYGPCIKVTNDKTKKTIFVKIPKDTDPSEIEVDEVKELVANYKPGDRFKKKDGTKDDAKTEDNPKKTANKVAKATTKKAKKN